MKITKVDYEKGYLCFAANKALKIYCMEEERKWKSKCKPPASGKFTISTFIDSVLQGHN